MELIAISLKDALYLSHAFPDLLLSEIENCAKKYCRKAAKYSFTSDIESTNLVIFLCLNDLDSNQHSIDKPNSTNTCDEDSQHASISSYPYLLVNSTRTPSTTIPGYLIHSRVDCNRYRHPEVSPAGRHLRTHCLFEYGSVLQRCSKRPKSLKLHRRR